MRLRALQRYLVSSKSPSTIRDGDEGVAGRNEREEYIDEGPLMAKTMNFHKKGNKIELVGRPGAHHLGI